MICQNSIEKAAQLLRDSGWAVLPPWEHTGDMDDVFLALWKETQPFTMISVERAWALVQALRYISGAGIPGDIVECGVWKGGACLLASHILHRLCRREGFIWLYDTFSGMTAPGSEDKIAGSGQAMDERNPEGWWAASVDDVLQTLKQSPLDMSRFKLVKGDVKHTLKQQKPQQIALLRLDTDWYESTLAELQMLYPLLSPGGVLIIDDYGHFSGAKKAVDHFFADIGLVPLLHRSDYTGRVFVKPLAYSMK